MILALFHKKSITLQKIWFVGTCKTYICFFQKYFTFLLMALYNRNQKFDSRNINYQYLNTCAPLRNLLKLYSDKEKLKNYKCPSNIKIKKNKI